MHKWFEIVLHLSLSTKKTKIKGVTIQEKNHFSELQGKCFFKVAKSKF